MKHVAGGQLVQETDNHATTWGARIVCVDDDGVRGVMTAHWLKQMGWDAASLTLDLKKLGTDKGDWKGKALGMDRVTVSVVDARLLQQRLQAGGVSVVDVDWSRDYFAGHIPGAWYGVRARLSSILPKLPPEDTIVFTSEDGTLAKLAASDVAATSKVKVLALEGGTNAWKAAGFELEKGDTRMGTDADDIRLRARDQSKDIEKAMQAYLAWEIELVNQMATDDDQRFSVVKS